MSNSIKEFLSAMASLKQLSESNISDIIIIKNISEEILDLTSNKPLPNRISLISKKSTNIIRKGKNLIEINKDITTNCNKIEILLLDLFKINNEKEVKIDYNELKQNYQRKNNELEKLKKFNENLNTEINELKNRLNAISNFGKFQNEELIDIYSIENFNINKSKKEIKKKELKSHLISEQNNKTIKEIKDKEKQFEEEIKKLSEENITNKKIISQQESEINKLKEEIKTKETESLNYISKISKTEIELKKLQDDYISLLKDNEEKKTSIINKDSLIKQLMKDCDDKKQLIQEEKDKNKNQLNELNFTKKELDELKQKSEKEKENYELKIKESQALASKNVPMLTKKFKELMLEIQQLKKDKNELDLKNKELTEEEKYE